MLSRDQFLAQCRHETHILKHLATKVPEGALDFKPTPGQRSTLELLRYVTLCAWLPMVGMVNGNWDHVEQMNAEAEEVTAETFADAVDRQMDRIAEKVDGLSDDDMRERDATLPWGAQVKLGQALVQTVLEPLVAYRMQLFLYAKQSGATELGSANCWIGQDGFSPPAN